MRQPDFEVIQRVLAGETAAFDGLVRQYQQEIYRLARPFSRRAIQHSVTGHARFPRGRGLMASA